MKCIINIRLNRKLSLSSSIKITNLKYIKAKTELKNYPKINQITKNKHL